MTSRHSRNSSVENDPIPRIPLMLHSEQESLISPLDRRSEAYRHIAAEVASHQPQPARQKLLTIPTTLTLFRLAMVPVVIFLWETQWQYSPITAAIVFIAASITDWLDGYLARRLKVASVFGAFLDPVADKVMVCSSLILLTTSPPPPIKQAQMLLPVCIMISREITMSALREWAAAAGGGAQKAVKVNSFGKWKTAFQMTSMGALLVLRQPQEDLVRWVPLAGPALVLGLSQFAFLLLWISTGLAAWSLAVYMSNVWTHFIYPTPPKKTS